MEAGCKANGLVQSLAATHKELSGSLHPWRRKEHCRLGHNGTAGGLHCIISHLDCIVGLPGLKVAHTQGPQAPSLPLLLPRHSRHQRLHKRLLAREEACPLAVALKRAGHLPVVHRPVVHQERIARRRFHKLQPLVADKTKNLSITSFRGPQGGWPLDRSAHQGGVGGHCVRGLGGTQTHLHQEFDAVKSSGDKVLTLRHTCRFKWLLCPRESACCHCVLPGAAIMARGAAAAF